MPHSKHTKRGFSLYLERWNPSAKRYLNPCVLCGAKGYSPAVDEPDFERLSWENSVTAKELRRMMRCLPLNEQGRCADCAARAES